MDEDEQEAAPEDEGGLGGMSGMEDMGGMGGMGGMRGMGGGDGGFGGIGKLLITEPLTFKLTNEMQISRNSGKWVVEGLAEGRVKTT